MKLIEIQLIEIFMVIAGYALTDYITKIVDNSTLMQTQLQRGRRIMIIKAVHILSFLTAIVLLSAIWGLKQNEIAVFVGTILTALGIAFFAQWSLLSNITSSLLLFFNHPMKIGDKIQILDKEYLIEGEVTDLTYFFGHLKIENGAIVTIPNSLLLQKSVAVMEKNKETKSGSK